MPSSTFTLVLMCAVPVIACTWIGILRGRKVKKEHRPENNHMSTVQGALLGLLGLLLGFAFSGAISRFVDRQDALADEANAIGRAYARAELLPTGDRVRASLREYAALRLRLFSESVDGRRSDLEQQLDRHSDAALDATIEGVREAPGFASISIAGIEGVNDQFNRRMALARRHMPTEFVLVMLVASCASMMSIGYSAGLAERRSIGSVMTLATLTATTLFITFDFDRPRRGLIRLDPAPLEEVAVKIGAVPEHGG